MRKRIPWFVFSIILIGLPATQVTGQVVDKSASILTVPEQMGREWRHPTNVKECLTQIYQILPPVTIRTSALQVDQARLNNRLRIIIPVKNPRQGIQEVHWVAKSWIGAKTVLQLFQGGQIGGVKVLPFDTHAIPATYWKFDKQEATVQEDLKACKKERIAELFQCRDCLITELVEVTP